MSDEPMSSVDITRHDDGRIVVAIYGDKCQGSPRDKTGLCASVVDLDGAQCDMRDLDDLVLLRDGIDHLLAVSDRRASRTACRRGCDLHVYHPG